MQLELAAGDARDVQQVVDQLLEMRRLPADDPALPLEPDVVAPLHQLHGRHDGRKRIAQLVPQHGQELVLAAIGQDLPAQRLGAIPVELGVPERRGGAVADLPQELQIPAVVLPARSTAENGERAQGASFARKRDDDHRPEGQRAHPRELLRPSRRAAHPGVIDGRVKHRSVGGDHGENRALARGSGGKPRLHLGCPGRTTRRVAPGLLPPRSSRRPKSPSAGTTCSSTWASVVSSSSEVADTSPSFSRLWSRASLRRRRRFPPEARRPVAGARRGTAHGAPATPARSPPG